MNDSGADAAQARNFIRGQAFHSLTAAATETLGISLEDLFPFLGEPLRDAFHYRAMVRSGWFPIEWYTELHRAIAHLNRSGRAVPSLHRRLGALACEQDIRGIYRFILGFSSPGFVVNNLGRILGNFVKASGTRIIESTPESTHLRITILGASPELWDDIAGSAEVVLNLCGAKSPQVALEAHSPSEAELRARWTLRDETV